MRIQIHIDIDDNEIQFNNGVLRSILKYCDTWGDQFNNDMNTDGVMYLCCIDDEDGNVLYD